MTHRGGSLISRAATALMHADSDFGSIPSPLELLHPDGTTRCSLVLGSACPPVLAPRSAEAPGALVDLVILAPGAGELGRGWAERSASEVATRLDHDGLAYVLAPWHARRHLAASLRNLGFSIGPLFLHAPSRAVSRDLIPVAALPARFALSELLSLNPLLRRIVGALAGSAVGRRLVEATDHVGVVARRDEVRPLFEWLYRLDGAHPSGCVIVTRSWRSVRGAVVLRRFSPLDRTPSLIAKVSSYSSVEPQVLRDLGPNARLAGADVPVPVAASTLGEAAVLLQSAVAGKPLARVLGAQPGNLSDVLERVAEWLEAWHRLTTVPRRLTAGVLERELLEPARLLACSLDNGAPYVDRLERLCEVIAGATIPMAAAHNDLTMANVLSNDGGRLAVIDWESGSAESLPLVDFFYAAADAVAAMGSYADRAEAFSNSFGAGGSFAEVVLKYGRRLVYGLELPADVVGLSFHACWLHHAANEERQQAGAGTRPFLEIVRRVADTSMDALWPLNHERSTP